MSESAPKAESIEAVNDEKRYLASQWKLMWWKFLDHRLAVWSGCLLCVFYFVAVFCEFLAPTGPATRSRERSFAPPQRIHLFHEGRLSRPFVYDQILHVNEETLRRTYTEDTAKPMPIRFFVKGDPYKLWKIIPMERHLFGVGAVPDGNGGVKAGRLNLLGADRLGRDLLSRIFYGTRISLSIGLVGVALSLILGVVIGGVSGYYSGLVDTLIQRLIEILRSFPTFPLWLALAAAMPPDWSGLQAYFCMTVILAFVSWTGLARVVRGKILSLREEDYAMAAKVCGVRDFSILMRHLVPGFMSHLIVSMTLSVPAMILGETSLSFLGIGLRPPSISWGVLLQDAQSIAAISLYPWLLWPIAFVIVAVLLFNFLGDGLRDAADPYGR